MLESYQTKLLQYKQKEGEEFSGEIYALKSTKEIADSTEYRSLLSKKQC